MSITIESTKVVVRDLEAAVSFYCAMGLTVASRNVGGEGEVAQEQAWVSAVGDEGGRMLILSHFLNVPPPPRPTYPNEAWLTFRVSDIDATVDTVQQAGGSVLRAGQDRPEHGVRAAVVSDPEGHVIELVGPMIGR